MPGLDDLLKLALAEDLGYRDVTTEATIGESVRGQTRVVAREPLVLSGSKAFGRVFHLTDPECSVEAAFADGARIEKGAAVFTVTGRVRSILTAERVGLNLLQRLCGVATLTRTMVREISHTRARLLDTRKTTPLWRALEKDAVRHGGGFNHRFNLSDGILIKDNHVAACGGVKPAVEAARAKAPHTLRVEVEVDGLDQLDDALAVGAEVILLDNFTCKMLREAVKRTHGRALLEASGGITLETVRAVAETGVDFISCGALTHSAPSIDLSMELDGIR